jgi:hypothetical protein
MNDTGALYRSSFLSSKGKRKWPDDGPEPAGMRRPRAPVR